MADISQVADAIISMCDDINTALTPIIGPKGVAALYRRSLLLCSSAHPPFADAFNTLVAGMDLDTFRALLLTLDAAHAASLSEQLLTTFYELLATLIGRSLAARLLLDVWGHSLSGPAPQDTSR